MSDNDEVDRLAATANSASLVEMLFGHWQQDARREYATARDQVSARVGATGNSQGSGHIKLLCDAAENCVFAMLSKARTLPIGPESYPIALSSSCALLVELGADIRATAIGANGRSPTPDNAILVDNLINEAKVRIEAEIEKWSLEDRTRSSDRGALARSKLQGITKEGGIVPPNRKLNHHKIIKQAISMRADQEGISIGSAAASIVADLPRNPKSGKPRDTRHIERIIAHLWEGGLSQSPR